MNGCGLALELWSRPRSLDLLVVRSSADGGSGGGDGGLAIRWEEWLKLPQKQAGAVSLSDVFWPSAGLLLLLIPFKTLCLLHTSMQNSQFKISQKIFVLHICIYVMLEYGCENLHFREFNETDCFVIVILLCKISYLHVYLCVIF